MNSKAIKRQLLAAIAMVLVAAIALGSSTYAWFVASGTVTAKGMAVQAQAQGGILIKEYNNNSMTFGTIANIGMEAGAELYPTSTSDLATWYHALSTNADKSKYTEAGSEVYVGDDYTTLVAGVLDDYRLVKRFAIRSATSESISNAALAIKDVTVTGGTAAQNFNKALRVGVKVTNGGDSAADPAFYVYAPVCATDFTLAAGYTDGSGLVEKVKPAAGDNLVLNGNVIPANDSDLIVDVYIWFEGEDPECKTTNVYGITMDTLSVSVTFEQIKAA